MLELKIVDENKIKRAAIFLKNFSIWIMFLLSKRLTICALTEPQGVDVTNFLYNLQQPTNKIDLSKYSKILCELDISADLVYNTHAKKVVDQFDFEDEKETASEQPKQKTKKSKKEDYLNQRKKRKAKSQWK